MDRDLGLLRELLGAPLTASCSLSSFFAGFELLQTSIFQISQTVFAEKPTFAHNSQDVAAENVISEVIKTVVLQFLMTVSTEIAVFQSSTDVYMDFLILFV